jgi:hypothetical protein
MMHLRDLDEGLVSLAEVASTCGQISIDATRCNASKSLFGKGEG